MLSIYRFTMSVLLCVGDVFNWPRGDAHSLETNRVPATATNKSHQG